MQNHRNLKVIPKATALTVLVYDVTRQFPRAELYGMTQQMRNAAKGIGLAIAEGCGRDTTREMIRYLTIANGSAQELEYAAGLSAVLKFAPADELGPIIAGAIEIQKMLCTYIKRLKER